MAEQNQIQVRKFFLAALNCLRTPQTKRYASYVAYAYVASDV